MGFFNKRARAGLGRWAQGQFAVSLTNAVMAGLLLAGCGVGSDSDASPKVNATDTASQQGMIPYPGTGQQKSLREQPSALSASQPTAVGALSPAEEDAVARARLALAQKLGLDDVDAATLMSVTAQQWNNGSLGCPKPGEMSTQVMLAGYKVVLVHDTLRHQVHVGPGNARVCERLSGLLAAPRRSISLGAIPGLQQKAIADLAQRFGVPTSSIRAERVAAAFWPNAALGCPEPGVEYPKMQVNGYELPLRVNGTLVVYNTDGRRLVNCDEVPEAKAPVTF